MKKLLTAVLLAATIIVPTQIAQAADEKVLAIIDTAIDSNKITSVIYEACFTSGPSVGCPNKSTFMEGRGAANARVWPSSMLSPVYHGHTMTQTALAASPNIKIVFIRISDMTDQGGISNQPDSIIRAVDWVSKNASKYSIDAVSISQSGISTSNLLLCTNNTTIINAVSTLNQQSIPVFAATGNDGLLDKVGFPSCVTGVVGVGALASTSSPKLPSSYTIFAKATNRGPGLDVVAQGDMNIIRYNGTTVEANGTSVANAITASLYVNNNIDKNVNTFINTFSKVLTYPYISR